MDAGHHNTMIEMLCANMSGIKTPIPSPRLEGGKVSWCLDQKHVDGRRGRRAAAWAMLKRPQDVAPGTEWAHHPGSMILVALVPVEKAGKDIEGFLKLQVWDRLRMKETGLGLAQPGTARTATAETAVPVGPPNPDPPPQNPSPQNPRPHKSREKDIKTNQI
jgi:CubicO group peptidase (beta-lactamase class C family)